MWKAQCLCTSNRGTCFTVSHVSALLIYVCPFSYWTEICSGMTSNRVAKVKCLPFLWQLLSDHWCQQALRKHPGISLCLSVCEWRRVRSHRPVAGYATVRHYTAAVSPSMQQAFFFIDVFARMKGTGWISQPQLRRVPAFPGQSPLHEMWLCHCYLCFNGVILLLRRRNGGMTLWFVEVTFETNLLQCCYGRQFFSIRYIHQI